MVSSSRCFISLFQFVLAFSRIVVLASFSMPWASQALLCKAAVALVVYECCFLSVVVILKDIKSLCWPDPLCLNCPICFVSS